MVAERPLRFLHVALQIALLHNCASRHDVKRTLAALPANIQEFYRETWKRILDQDPVKALLARNVLTWVMFATRSLTIDELREAVAICPDTHKFERDRMVPESTLIGACHGLVAVEETTQRVRLVRE
jgi:ankyrin repeat domain-containing protein 50